jgi:aspartyl-tRNA(Asn)/glutamyl-tRNA(Gln) amidotransferase subunit A
MDLTNLTIKKFREGLDKKEFSAFEAAEEFFKKIEKEDPEIKAFLRLSRDLALSQASEVDVKLAKGEKLDIMAGVPTAVKDNILAENEPATSASEILKNYRAPYDATVIKKLKEKNAVILGKTNLDEFAMGSSTENSAFQTTKNPRDKTRVPGGSSGGSAAAVASDMSVVALGSDTGGSVRLPASFCGVVGLKPTYGAVSRYGLMAMASSLDQIGPIAKTVEDAELLFDAIRGEDPLDSTSFPASGKGVDFDDLKNMTIGLPKEYFIEGLDEKVKSEVEKAVEKLKILGVKFKEISLPHAKYALSCYYIIMPAEVSANLARFDGIRYSRLDGVKGKTLKDVYFEQKGEGFGEEAKRRIILGTFVLSSGYYDAYYVKAQKARRLIKEDFEKVFDKSADNVDAVLTPVSPTTAFKIGEKKDDPMKMYLSDIFTITPNLAGLPAISIPTRLFGGRGEEGDLPVGFQLIGKRFGEKEILSIGKYYERL